MYTSFREETVSITAYYKSTKVRKQKPSSLSVKLEVHFERLQGTFRGKVNPVGRRKCDFKTKSLMCLLIMPLFICFELRRNFPLYVELCLRDMFFYNELLALLLKWDDDEISVLVIFIFVCILIALILTCQSDFVVL